MHKPMAITPQNSTTPRMICGVIAIGLCIRYVVVRARQGVMDNLPVALRGLRGLRDLKNLPNNFDFDPDAYGGPRDTADTWTYQAKVVPQHWVWIRNTVGSVRVEAAKGDSLEVVAVKTHHRSDPGSVHIETIKVADGIAICAVWGQGRGRCGPGEDFKPSSLRHNDVAVDFTVRLPKRVRLGASTVNGAVHVAIETDYPLVVTGKLGKHLQGTLGAGGRKVRITTVNGAINLRKTSRPS